MNPNPALRSTLHRIARLTLTLLTRTTIIGQENIPAHGPLLILANHSSTIDPMLLGMGLPETTEGVGAGDFKLLFPANVIMAWYGLIPVKRSLQLDRASLKLMTDMLNSGKMLSLFPQGGTWEKPITDAKAGAAYLSMITGAPILPVALGGTYRAWDKVVRLQRPHLTLTIGTVMPPVQAPAQKSQRGDVLDAATQEIMQRIYELLPPADQRWYDELAATRYNLDVEIWRWKTREPIRLPGSAVLGEVLLKPNLISPLIQNAKLPLGPMLKHGVHFPADLVRTAATSLQSALHSSYEGYMEYRLGIDKSQQLYAALDALIDLTNSPGVGQIVLKPTSYRYP
ncbi:MAG: lysophospholipid acyltransferase family protein [Chloroflexota bacterium]